MQTPVKTNPQNVVKARKDIRDVIQGYRAEIEKALPRHLSADRMIRVMLTTVNGNEKLLQCSQSSLLAALMKCSQYGLEPDGRHAHLIPYKDECKLIFDYKGIVNLIRRSGEVVDVHCDVVYEKDEFEFAFGSNGKLSHKPNLKDPDRGAITCAYSFVKMKDGSTSYEVMPWWEIEKVKEASEGYQAFLAKRIKSTPWETHWAEMAKKTVLRRHSKWLPFSFEISEAVNADDDIDARFNNAKVVTSDVHSVDLPPAPALPEPEPPTKQLLAWLDASAIPFETFAQWAKSEGHINEVCTADEFPDEVAARLLRSKDGVLKKVQAFQEESMAAMERGQ